jgi:hypothetical protein
MSYGIGDSPPFPPVDLYFILWHNLANKLAGRATVYYYL